VNAADRTSDINIAAVAAYRVAEARLPALAGSVLARS